MNKYNAVGIIALLIVVAVLPIYALFEPGRMDGARAELSRTYVTEGADLYVQNCAVCHGAAGEGIGAMPALNNPGLVDADRDMLYDTIARSAHGTAMSSWHVEEGGSLNSYQVEGLVTLIQTAEWSRVGELAADRGVMLPTPVPPEDTLVTMEGDSEDPHECRACHEEPELHAEQFGLNCSRCHTLEAWKPALLTRHTFMLDHGDEGKVACETCHTETYSEHTCYGCHDHEPEQMRVAHVEEEIPEFERCVECHPTGLEGEAANLGYGLSGRANAGESPQAGETEQPGIGGPDLPGIGDPIPFEDPGQETAGENAGADGADQTQTGDGAGQGQSGQGGGAEGSGKPRK